MAEQGRHSDYVRNLEANPLVRVWVRRGWRRGEATVVGIGRPTGQTGRVRTALAREGRSAGRYLIAVSAD
ncbi:nitroreductase/quinone reductase family protein [Kibdelosporangium aridum]|uniref:nitroreductase/quinone reductase family protein n=1 Tax=Kibdelosporangium aridum TaxID=2030 RepID=UPI0038993DCB